MKIEGPNVTPPNPDTIAGASTNRTAQTTRDDTVAGVGGTQTSDRVVVSRDARLLNEALKAAEAAPAVRADRVEEVSNKLQSGEIGTDADALAGTMLDDLLNS